MHVLYRMCDVMTLLNPAASRIVSVAGWRLECQIAFASLITFTNMYSFTCRNTDTIYVRMLRNLQSYMYMYRRLNCTLNSQKRSIVPLRSHSDPSEFLFS